MTPFFAILVFTATVGAPLAGGACDVQPSTIAVSLGHYFTVSCTYPCDGYETHLWLREESRSVFDRLPTSNYNTSIIQDCAGPGTNATQELTILASDDIRDLELMVCVVLFRDAGMMPCMDSATLEITDGPPVCEVEQSIDVVLGEWISLSCTILCNVHETITWFTQDMVDIFDVLPEGNINTIHPVQTCDNLNVSNVTYGIEVLVTSETVAIGSILCLATPIDEGDDNDCITSASFNNIVVTEPPTATPDHGLTTSSTVQAESLTSTSKVVSSSFEGTTDSSCQLLSNVKLLALFMTFTLVCILH